MMKKLFILLITLIGLNIPTFALDFDDPNIMLSILQNGSPEVQEYNLKVAKKIIAKFEMPKTNKHLATIVIFKIDTSGNLVEYNIQQSSGDNDYDNRVVTAIKNAAPYPVPTFIENDGAEVMVNMDLSIIQLIKMLSDQFNYPLDSLIPSGNTSTPGSTQQKETQTTTPSQKDYEKTIQQPSGIRFINPNDIKDFD